MLLYVGRVLVNCCAGQFVGILIPRFKLLVPAVGIHSMCTSPEVRHFLGYYQLSDLISDNNRGLTPFLFGTIQLVAKCEMQLR